MWYGNRTEYEDTARSPGGMTRKTAQAVKTCPGILSQMAFNLLKSNRQLFSEAAPVFYRPNMFRFTGQINCNWSPLYSFLEMIGEENRNKLRRLEMSIFQPQHVYQYPDGTRTTMDGWRFREAIPQSSFARSFPATAVDQEPRRVEHLDPAIEACFRILGTRRLPLTLVLILGMHILPGVPPPHDPYAGEPTYVFGLDMPIFIESCRKSFTVIDDTTSLVEVLWRGECTSDCFTENTTFLQDLGWVIVEKKEGTFADHNRHPTGSIRFTLRR